MIHIAVLFKSYLDLVLSGRKTIECRLTMQARDPYERIEAGERIYFKQSSGPYRAAATVDHVMFEDDLTPKRIDALRRDYNDGICGEKSFWRRKRSSNYCTLIWLRDVMAIDSGPEIRPLQGVAWLCLDEDPAWRRVRATGDDCFAVEITNGNLKNNTLYVSDVIDRFPRWAIGGKDKSQSAKPVTLVLHQGPTVQTDIVGPRKLLRTRIWGKWFRQHEVAAGDHVVFTPVDQATYWVGITRQSGEVT
jgi:ASC-1-like (ASCH) protein